MTGHMIDGRYEKPLYQRERFCMWSWCSSITSSVETSSLLDHIQDAFLHIAVVCMCENDVCVAYVIGVDSFHIVCVCVWQRSEHWRSAAQHRPLECHTKPHTWAACRHRHTNAHKHAHTHCWCSHRKAIWWEWTLPVLVWDWISCVEILLSSTHFK